MVERSKDLYVDPSRQTNIGERTANVRSVCITQIAVIVIVKDCGVFVGQEHQADGDGAETKLAEHLSSRRDSVSSQDSAVSSSVQPNQPDHPEQYEVIKQQKEIIEHGIEL